MLKHTYISAAATKVDTCRFVIHTNMSKRSNEIKEHRHVYACIIYVCFVD